MPVYEYQCDSCGLRAEKLWKLMSVAASHFTIPCESCGEDMRKLVSSGVGFSFTHGAGQTRGALPPNTGTSDDFNYDKAIGRDAEQKWKAHEKRNTVKDTVIRDEHKVGREVTREQLVPTNEGYRTITEPERVSVNHNRQAAFKIAHAAKTSGVSPKKD